MPPSDKPEPPKPPKGPGFGSRRGKRSLKLLRTLRGDGMLLAAGRSLAVSYQLDLYADGDRTVGSGSLDGDFTGLAEDLEGGEAMLTLEDGDPTPVTLETVEDDGAEFQMRTDGA
ncbi:MAG: hypothetical protein Q7T19_13775 [Caulobacter sp.]|nr:hypothetical protein [Caulobacter sp.]